MGQKAIEVLCHLLPDTKNLQLKNWLINEAQASNHSPTNLGTVVVAIVSSHGQKEPHHPNPAPQSERLEWQ